MRYRHVHLYKPLGISLPKDAPTTLLLDRDASGVRVQLASSELADTQQCDENGAIASILAGKLFGTLLANASLEDLAQETRRVRDERAARHGAGPYLIVIGEGDWVAVEPAGAIEMQAVSLLLDDPANTAVRKMCAERFEQALASVALASHKTPTFDKLAESTVLLRDDGRPVYCLEFRFNATLTVSSQLKPEAPAAVAAWFDQLVTNPSLGRVWRLLVSSYGSRTDRLRAFLWAWSTLEILVNKIYPRYDDLLFAELARGDHPEARKGYVRRVRTVMNDKYRLTDKFAVTAALLAAAEADGDCDLFARAKKNRDDLAHGQDIEEASLPIDSVQQLAAKYLRLHLSSIAPTV